MGKYNWNLTRIGVCKHKVGKESWFIKNEKIIFSNHSGKKVVQIWTGKEDDGNNIDGWHCAHTDDDEKSIRDYLLEKEEDLKSKDP